MTIRTAITCFSISNAVILLLTIIGFIAFSNYQGAKLERLVKRDLAFSRAIDQTYSIGLRTGIALRNMAINPKDEVAINTFEKSRTDFMSKLVESRQIYSGKANAIMGEVAPLWEKAEPIKTRISTLLKEGRQSQALSLIEEDTEIWRDIRQLIDRAREEQDKELAASIKENKDLISKGNMGVALLFLIGIIGLAGTVIVAFTRILRPIEKLVSAFDRVGTGDLSQTIHVATQDELGKLASEFNSMVSRLRSMVVRLTISSDELKAATVQISEVARQVVDSSEIQATGVHETSSAVMEIASSISTVAVNVEHLSAAAGESSTSTLEMAANIDEVAQNIEGLEKSVAEVSSSVVEMATAVKQINGNVQHLSDIATMTASSIAQMDSSIKEVERNTIETVAISDDVLKDAMSGKNSVEATIVGIYDIRKASGVTIDAIRSLDAKTHDIGKIVQVIDNVAEQTNLLALNASIIAAQTGHHGKGFAVVAHEIKELANRTRQSTMEITEVIKTVQSETHRVASSITMADNSIAHGEQLSRKSGEALQKIVNGIQLSSERMNHIAKATSEQSKGSKMIRQAMDQVSEMLGQIARATNEQGKGSELIMESAELMKSLTREANLTTREQANVSNYIANTTEKISSMVRQVKQATDEQNLSSNMIAQSIESIQCSTHANTNATSVLNEVTASLSQQVEVLQEEMTRFRL